MPNRLTSHDLARISCSACEGCGECCRGMDDTIHLDPYDVCLLSQNLGTGFGELLNTRIGLHVDGGLVLPHLLMDKETDACSFLGPDGRCSIHAFRPGFCRLYPLGRVYENGTLGYFVTDSVCPGGRSKVRIHKWLEIADLPRYEAFLLTWHDFRKDVQKKLLSAQDMELSQKTTLYILDLFYGTPTAPGRDFHTAFARRIKKARKDLGLSV